MKRFPLLLALVPCVVVLVGCATSPKTDHPPSPPRDPVAKPTPRFWTPTLSERDQAEQIAREYATHKLGLSLAQVAKMKTDCTGFHRGDARELLIQFYDPHVFQPLPSGRFEGMRGGFPRYFTITVNVPTWTVSHHYASRA